MRTILVSVVVLSVAGCRGVAPPPAAVEVKIETTERAGKTRPVVTAKLTFSGG